MREVMRLTLIVMALLWAMPSHAAVHSGFPVEWDTKPGSPWSYSTGAGAFSNPPNPGATVDCTMLVSPSGGCALRMLFPAGNYTVSVPGGRATIGLSENMQEFYWGHWVRWSPGFVWHPVGNKVDYTHGAVNSPLLGGTNPPYVALRVHNDGQQSIKVDNGIGVTGTSNPHTYSNNIAGVNLVPGIWYWFVLHVKLNAPTTSSNGVIEVFVDDVLKLQVTTARITDVANSWGGIEHSPEWGGAATISIPADQYTWFDHTVLSTTYPASPGGSVPVDNTSPTAPVISVASTSITSATITITTASTDNALAGYTLRRGTGVGCTPSTTLTNLPPSPLTYNDNTVSPGQTYCYDLRGFDQSSNVSAFSAVKSVTIGTGGGTTSPIVFDAASNSAAANTTNAITWNHTTGAGSNRLLTVCAQARDTVTLGDTAVTGITYGGLALTKIRHDVNSTGGVNVRTELWNLIAPPSGTAAVAIAWTGALNNYGVGSAVTYTGVTQTSFNDANTGATGSSTTPTADITTVTDGSVIVDCMLDTSNGQVVGAGQTQRANRDTTANTDGTGVSETIKSTAGVETMSWTATTGGWALSTSSFKPGVTVSTAPPTITGLSFTSSGGSLTGFDITVGATPPTYVLVQVYTSQGIYSSQEYAYSAFTAGHLALTVPGGVEGLCAYPRSASGPQFQNNAPDAFRCLPFGSLVGPIDTTAPTLSNPQPTTTTLPSGTILTSVSVNMSKPASCLLSISNLSYAAMLAAGDNTTMSGVVPVVSANAAVAAGLNDFYAACRSTDVNGDTHDSTTLHFVVTVAAAPQSDTTKPSDVSGVSATVRGATAADIDWTLPTDDTALLQTEIFLSTDGTNYFISATVASPTHTVTIPGLSQNTLYYTKLQARDTSSNVSLNFSTPVTFTTDRLIDVTPPSTMRNLRAEKLFTGGATLRWDDGTDTGFGSTGSVTSTIEIALSTGGICGAYTQIFTDIATSKFTPNLSVGTAYCARGLHTDGQGNVSVDFSNVVSFTTATLGLAGPRAEVPPGLARSSVNRATPGSARPIRP